MEKEGQWGRQAISEEESNFNVVVKHSNTYQLVNRAGEGVGGGVTLTSLPPFTSWTMFKCLKTLLLGVIYSMKRGEN
jgi:hypothetical protein